MKKRWPTLQPAHYSPNITVEQAMEAWRKVEARAREKAREARRKRNELRSSAALARGKKKPAAEAR